MVKWSNIDHYPSLHSPSQSMQLSSVISPISFFCSHFGCENSFSDFRKNRQPPTWFPRKTEKLAKPMGSAPLFRIRQPPLHWPRDWHFQYTLLIIVRSRSNHYILLGSRLIIYMVIRIAPRSFVRFDGPRRHFRRHFRLEIPL